MRLMIRLAFAALLVCALAPFALAQAGPPPSGDQSAFAAWAPLVAAVLGLGAYLLRSWTPNTGWLHGALGHSLLVLLSGILGAGGEAIAEHGFSRTVLIMAAAGAIGGFLGASNPSARKDGMPPRDGATSGRASLVVLLAIAAIGFASALAMAGCHGYKAPTYATLAMLAEGSAQGELAIPPACEALETKAVQAAVDKAAAKASTATIHGRCVSAETVLSGLGTGLKTARDAVKDAPVDVPPDALAWISTLIKEYCDARPAVAFFGYVLPGVPGVC
jgi:hypothetical protein